jgi:hypothetical protein
VHDSQELETLIDQADAGLPLYADAAYIRQKAASNGTHGQ